MARGLELGELGRERAMIFELRSGKARRLTICWGRDRALADLGLEGWAVSEENMEIVRRAF
jgi:hypothetical protein